MEQEYKAYMHFMQKVSLYQAAIMATEFMGLSYLKNDPAMKNLFKNMTKEDRGAFTLACITLQPLVCSMFQ